MPVTNGTANNEFANVEAPNGTTPIPPIITVSTTPISI
jgi:hypothetical protein